jgi:precorrin-3B C17-methyltransferase
MSGRRTRQIVEAQRILLKYRSPQTPVGLVKSAYRDRQSIIQTTLEDMMNHEIGMLTTVLIGNSTTFIYDGLMITPRGYQRKYTLSQKEQPLKPHQRLKKEAEPWALEQVTNTSTRAIADEALQLIMGGTKPNEYIQQPIQSIFEVSVSPGVANKKFTPKQMMTLADIVGEDGSMEYTQDHHIKLQVPTTSPEWVVHQLEQVGFLLAPVGDVLTLKACDFCEGEKKDAIPYAELLQAKLGGMELPKEMKIGFNGCGMACFGAVREDIGIVYRKGAFDLFLGGKTIGRNAHSGQIVAEGIAAEEIVGLVERIVQEYKEKGHPNERFHKFFKRVKSVCGFEFLDVSPSLKIEPAPCGD